MERGIERDITGRSRAVAAPELRRLASGTIAWAARHATVLSLAGSLLLVLALYGDALGYAFFFDDTFDLARVEGRSYWSLLSSSEGYSYYRPIPFVVWKLLRDVQGHYDQTTLHAIPLLIHALNGWLLYLLARRLGAGHWALVPAVLFLTTPFHYQSVPIVGTVFHPLAGLGILAALVLYLKARERSGGSARRVHLAALGATVVALWGHESGVVVAPLIVGLEGLLLLRSGSRRPSRWVAAHLAATLLFGLAWLSVEKTPFGEETSLAELHPKVMFFLQGFTYPVSAQRQWLADERGVSLGLLELTVPALVLVMGVYLLSAWRTRRWWMASVPALGLVIAVVAAAPSLARLSWPYIENSPRLLYLGSLGAALVWGLLPSLRFGDRRIDVPWRAATLVLLAFVVVQSWRFIDIRLAMYARATEVVNGVVAQGERYQGQRLVVYNLPSWFAQDRYEYQYGHYGVQVIPSYIGLDRVIYTSSERSATVDAASAAWQPEVSGAVTFGPHGAEVDARQLDTLAREEREVVAVTRDGDGFRVRDVGRMRTGAASALPSDAGRLGDSVSVTPARAVLLEDQLVVYLQWNVIAPFGIDAETIVELRDAAGEVVARYQGAALGGFSPPRFWQAGDQLDDSVAFPAPPPGRYSVHVGLQHVGSDERLVARTTDGDEPADRLLPAGELEVGLPVIRP